MNSATVRVAGDPNPKEQALHPDRRLWIPRFLTTVARFAVDSAVSSSVKGLTGAKKVYKIVQEELITSLASNDKKPDDSRTVVDKMQAKMEKMQEGTSNVKQQIETSAEQIKTPLPLKKTPNENTKGSELLRTEEKRIFIRSRL